MIKSIVLLLSFLLSVIGLTYPQQVYQFNVKHVDYERCNVAHSIVCNHNLYACGRFSEVLSKTGDSVKNIANKEWDVFVSQFNNNGDILWYKQHKGLFFDIANDIAVDTSGNIYVTGCFTDAIDIDGTKLESNGQTDIFIAKYNNTGKLVWVQNFGGDGYDMGESITCDNRGNIYVCGYFSDMFRSQNQLFKSEGLTDAFIAKYDTSGRLAWMQQAGGNLKDEAKAVTVSNDNNIYVTGCFGGSAIFQKQDILLSKGDWDIFTAKYNDKGKLIWVKPIGDEYYDKSYSTITDNDENIYICGNINVDNEYSYITSDVSLNIFVAKYDKSGKQLWLNNIDGSDYDRANDIALDDSNNIYITGSFKKHVKIGDSVIISKGETDVFIAKLNSEGAPVWFKQGGGELEDESFGICIDNNNIYITGFFTKSAIFGNIELSSSYQSNMFIASYDLNGEIIWVKQYE